MKKLKYGAKLPVGYPITFPQLNLTGMVVEENGAQYINEYCVSSLQGQYYTTKKESDSHENYTTTVNRKRNQPVHY